MRRSLRFGSVLLLAAALLLQPFVTRSVSAAGGPAINGVRFSQSQVNVGGLSYVNVLVAVDLSDPDGVKSGRFGDVTDSYWRPHVTLSRPAGSGSYSSLGINNFQLVAGTATSGTWVATFPVLAVYGGTWEPTEVIAEDNSGNTTDVDPRTSGFDPTLVVHASGVPSVSMSFSPSIVHRGQTVTMSGYLRDDHGFGFGGQLIYIGQDTLCGVDGFGYAQVLTSSTGRYSYSWVTTTANSLTPYPRCAFLLLPGVADGSVASAGANNVGAVGASGFVRAQYALLGVHPASASVRVGAADSVTGSVWPFGDQMPFAAVVLQRLVGDTWRSVERVHVRVSGRFTLTANPPARGRNVYRVVKPGDYCGVSGCEYLGTASAAFVITGS